MLAYNGEWITNSLYFTRARNAARLSSELGRREKKRAKESRSLRTNFFFLYLCNFVYLFASLPMYSSPNVWSVSPSIVDIQCAFALAISEVTHEWKIISIAPSIYEAAPNHCMDYSICEHNKWCTGHVTLPCLRCDHVIPEINTRVTLSHERRAGEVTRWSQTDRKKRRIRVT